MPEQQQKSTLQPTSHANLHEDTRGRLRRNARTVARVLLLIVIGVAMLWQGGVSTRAMQVLSILLALTWVATIPAEPHRRPQLRTGWLWLGLGGWTLLQVLPLPRAITALLHPFAVATSDATHVALGEPVAALIPIAVAPGDAAMQAAVYLMAGVVALIASEIMLGSQGRRFVNWITNSLIGLGLLSGALWLAQRVLVPSGMLPGSLAPLLDQLVLVNDNHQTGLLNLSLGVALGYAVNAGAAVRQLSYGIAALALSALVMYIGSRGGVMVAAIMLMGTLVSTPQPPKYMRTHPKDRAASARWRAALLAASVLLVGAIAALPVLEREFLHSGSIQNDFKVKFIREGLRFAVDAPLLGWGPGTLPVVIGQQLPLNARFDFAENLVIERLTDEGLVGGPLFFAALGLYAWHLHKRTKGILEPKPFVVAAVGFLVANLVDFSFEIPGGLLTMALVTACIEYHVRQSQAEREKSEHHRGQYHMRILAVTAAALIAVLYLVLTIVPQRLTRDVDTVVAGAKAAEARALTLQRFSYDSHALYLVARAQHAEGRMDAALKAFDRAVALRPFSAHARLFRFAVRLEAGLVPKAAEDMLWLLNADADTVARTLQVCQKSSKAEALLLEVMPKVPQRSLELARSLEYTRPDLVERVAVELRKRYPDKRFGIEVLRATLYIRRGALAPAKAIAAALLADETTQPDGWLVQGRILRAEGKSYEAFHAFKSLCDHKWAWDPCASAVESLLDAQRPAQALEFTRAQWPRMRESPNWAAMWWRWMGTAYDQAGDPESSLDAYRNAHNLLPEDLPIALLLATCLEKQQLFGELTELSEGLQHRYPQDKAVQALADRITKLAQPLVMANRPPSVVTPTAAELPSAVTKLRP